MNNDPLKKFVDQHREEFDVREPDQAVFERIKAKLKQEGANVSAVAQPGPDKREQTQKQDYAQRPEHTRDYAQRPERMQQQETPRAIPLHTRKKTGLSIGWMLAASLLLILSITFLWHNREIVTSEAKSSEAAANSTGAGVTAMASTKKEDKVTPNTAAKGVAPNSMANTAALKQENAPDEIAPATTTPESSHTLLAKLSLKKGSQNLPHGKKNLPHGKKNRPEGAQNLPEGAQNLPDGVQSALNQAQHISRGQQNPAKNQKEMLMRLPDLAKVYQLLSDSSSASNRLSAVLILDKAKLMNDDLISRLSQTLNQDPNSNVRLAALNALSPYLPYPAIRRVLVQSLPQQQDPELQLSLIDLLRHISDPQLDQTLYALANNPMVLAQVQDQAYMNLLSQNKL